MPSPPAGPIGGRAAWISDSHRTDLREAPPVGRGRAGGNRGSVGPDLRHGPGCGRAHTGDDVPRLSLPERIPAGSRAVPAQACGAIRIGMARGDGHGFLSHARLHLPDARARTNAVSYT